MKKFALTALTVALFSGSAMAITTDFDEVVVPKGYEIVSVKDKAGEDTGVIQIKKDGEVVHYEVLKNDAHIRVEGETEFTEFKGTTLTGKDLKKAENQVKKWNAANQPTGEGEGPLTDDDFSVDGRPDNKPMPNLSGGIINNSNNIAAMGEAFEQRVDAVNGYLSQAGQAIQNNSDRITNLESAFEQQAAHTAKEISRLDDRIDGIGAMSQAVTAARPQLFGNQTSAIGMGIGHMGDATALAAGYVHRINENWSANANISTTFGTDDRDTSVGAGVAYAW